ncbi:hypothetical protein MKD33_16215, partial [Chromobacterium piscinae]
MSVASNFLVALTAMA